MLLKQASLALLVIYLSLLLCVRGETSVKWTAAPVNENDPAANAPKSKKYWDEHGIPLPDYAKTDAEIAAERGGSETVITGMVFLLFLVAAAAIAYQYGKNWGGTRLEGTGSVFKKQLTEEERRKARLARFEDKTEKRE